MEYNWADANDDSLVEYEPGEPQNPSDQQKATDCARIDWENLARSPDKVKKVNTANDKQETSFLSKGATKSEAGSSKRKVVRPIKGEGTSLFSWGFSSTSNKQSKRQSRKRSYEEYKTGDYKEPASNRSRLPSKEIPTIQIDNSPVKNSETSQIRSSGEVAMSQDSVSSATASSIQTNDDIKEPEGPKVNPQHILTIEGVRVWMPVKPYKCQLQVMRSIITGCNKEQNCLLESPTGSGKTLALLCGALAWQSDCRNKFDEAKRLKRSRQEAATSKSPAPVGKPECGQSAGKCCEVDEMDLSMFNWDEDELSDYKTSEFKKVPKIYYGSRTHRQISQVVKELKKTAYADKRMTVLSSREFSCIQDAPRSKTELCAELLDPTKKRGCPYYNDHNKYTLGSYHGLQQNGVPMPFDIEDLVTAGRETRACPYFAARALMVEAEIIFCPYNYIIDPVIRESLQLDVHGDIIILDEAHNMEDICRSAGSVSLTDSILENIVNDCTNILDSATGKKMIHEVAYASMIESYCQSLRKFIETTKLNSTKGAFDSPTSDQWTGSDLLALFEITQLDQQRTSNFIRSTREAINLFNSAKEELRQGNSTNHPTLTTDSVRRLESILMALNMITTPYYAVDYRVVIKEITVGYKKERSLEFVCMNPGVIFSPLSAMARTIILASGTLAPTSSFASELGVEFPLTIQANHVTPRDQIFVRCVGKGPNGRSLRATYENLNKWDFQDEVGNVLVSVCEAVPHGILVFFASYGAMNTLVSRWQSNNMLNKIARTKTIFQETRGSADLPTMMTNYREAIRNTSNGPVGTIDGAILFAVFRGKVAEGIDFSDNEARAVVTIGIPFSSRNDPAIDMKLRYNDANRLKGLLSGHDLYYVSAFRALNQGVGRAIRHKNDWGSIILIDERFLDARHVNYLPAWVRSTGLTSSDDDPDLDTSLREFVARQKKRDNES